MRESCKYGSVRGAPSNGRPYRDRKVFGEVDEPVAREAWHDPSPNQHDQNENCRKDDERKPYRIGTPQLQRHGPLNDQVTL
jgi:hypothetical protein